MLQQRVEEILRKAFVEKKTGVFAVVLVSYDAVTGPLTW